MIVQRRGWLSAGNVLRKWRHHFNEARRVTKDLTYLSAHAELGNRSAPTVPLWLTA